MSLSLNLPVCIQSGDCGLCDILEFVGSIFNLLIMILAAGAFIMLIIGAVQFVFSRGNPETRKNGIKTLTSVTVGVFIGLLAWQIVNLTIFILVGNNKFDETGEPVEYKVFGNPWNEVCTGESFRNPGGCLDNNNQPVADRTICGNDGQCQGGVCVDSTTELAECLGKSNGSPCNNTSGHCLNGVCEEGDACSYIASEYTDKFGARTILDSKRVDKPLQKYQCVKVQQTQKGFIFDTSPPSDMQAAYPYTIDSKTSITLDCLEGLCPSGLPCCGEVAGF